MKKRASFIELKPVENTFLYILGAGASKSSGMPLACEVPDMMDKLALDTNIGERTRDALRVVATEIRRLGLNTVDDLAAYISRNYDNGYGKSKIYFTLFYVSQWATCAMLRHKQAQIGTKGIQSYKALLDELKARTQAGIVPHVLSFNYDSALITAYGRLYSERTRVELRHISGIDGWRLSEREDQMPLDFFYYKAHGSVEFRAPVDCRDNSFSIENLPEHAIEGGCNRALEEYAHSLSHESPASRENSVPAIPLLIFPSHFSIFAQAPDLTSVLKKHFQEIGNRFMTALDTAMAAKAIGYSFPDADRQEWLPILKKLWERKCPLLVQSGKQSTMGIVEKLRFEIRCLFKDALEARLVELIRSLPEDF